MRRRDLFKGIFGVAAGIVLAPLAKLVEMKRRISFNGEMIAMDHAQPHRIDFLNLETWGRGETKEVEFMPGFVSSRPCITAFSERKHWWGEP